MKILVVGAGSPYIYEHSIHDSFVELGITSELFAWDKLFSKNKIIRMIQARGKLFLGSIQRKFISTVASWKPDLIFIYRGSYIHPSSIANVRRIYPVVKIFTFNNDDPFNNSCMTALFSRYYVRSVYLSDWNFVYRSKNLSDLSKLKIYNASILRSYYIRSLNFPMSEIKKDIDVLFIGHYECDNRDRFIKYLMDNNVCVEIYGTSWKKSKLYSFFRSKLKQEIMPARSNYNSLMNQTKIALVFLSKFNNDSYTRRCFEIPASKTFMLCEYTDEMNSMFKEGVEAEYFRNKNELLEKIRFYLKHEDERVKISEAGYQRLITDGHESLDRAKYVLDVYNTLVNR